MKQFSKAMLVSTIVAATLAGGQFVSADRGGNDNGRHRGWLKPGKEFKFIDARDAETGIEIKQDGTAHIRGAKVTAVSGTTITATETLGVATLTWTITTDGSTKLDSKNGKPMTLADFAVGDTITAKGKMQSGGSLALTATSVRNISKALTPVQVNTQQTFEGVLTVVPGTTVPTSLTMNIGSSAQVVNISATTVVLNKDWAPTTLGSFVAGDKVRVFGFIPGSSSAITGIVLRNVTR
ncbi:MAG: hypothetical protein RI911_359 [Candidatus Parcubacteria bacterium]|jgi:hypothetical protein